MVTHHVPDAIQGSDADTFSENWSAYLMQGVGLVLLGFIGLGFMAATALVSTVLLGVVVLISGTVIIVSAFAAARIVGAFLRAALGMTLLLAGIYLIVQPVVGALTLTLFMTWYFIGTGILRIVSSAVERYMGWMWTLTAGVASLLLGVFLAADWPVRGLYAIGFFIGIDLIAHGIAWLAVALAARNYVPTGDIPGM